MSASVQRPPPNRNFAAQNRNFANRSGPPQRAGMSTGGRKPYKGPGKSVIEERNETNAQFMARIKDMMARSPPQLDPANVIVRGGPQETPARSVSQQPSTPAQMPQQPQEQAMPKQTEQSVEKQANATATGGKSYRERFWALRNEGKLTDITLFAEGLEIKANKMVLVMASNYFAKLFTKDPTVEVLPIANISPVNLQAVVEFAYRGQLANYAGLYQTADFFEMPELMALCPDQPTGVSKRNVVQEICKSLQTGNKNHQDSILAYIYGNPTEAEQAAQSVEVEKIEAENKPLANQIRSILAMKLI